MKDFWDQRYAEEEYVYGEFPNEFFRKEIEKLNPGKILLPGEGEGRNAVFAATLGWEVVAFDQSRKGRKKALELAGRKNVTLGYQVIGIDEFVADPGTFDCIAIIFVHFSEPERQILHKKLLSLLKTGGTLIMEVFSKDQLGRKSGGPQHLDLLYSEEDLRADFSGLNLLHIQALETNLHEGRYHEGMAAVIRLTGKK
jgi:SAM-dependent methyltransferase